MTAEVAGRALAPGLYFHEDLRPGDWYRTGGILVTESHVVGFAGLGGDFFDLHMDEAYARDLGFAGRAAHGLLVLALVDGLKSRAAVQLAAVASLGWDWTFAAPVFIGDRIEARLTVADTRLTSRGDRGIVRLRIAVGNQHGEEVQRGTNTLMMRRRDAGLVRDAEGPAGAKRP